MACQGVDRVEEEVCVFQKGEDAEVQKQIGQQDPPLFLLQNFFSFFLFTSVADLLQFLFHGFVEVSQPYAEAVSGKQRH